MCFGSTCDSAAESEAISAGAGALNLTTTVESSGVSTDVTFAYVVRPRGCSTFHTCSSENLTSAAVNGWPSCQVTPLRSLNVTVLPSALVDQLSASAGFAFIAKS